MFVKKNFELGPAIILIVLAGLAGATGGLIGGLACVSGKHKAPKKEMVKYSTVFGGLVGVILSLAYVVVCFISFAVTTDAGDFLGVLFYIMVIGIPAIVGFCFPFTITTALWYLYIVERVCGL